MKTRCRCKKKKQFVSPFCRWCCCISLTGPRGDLRQGRDMWLEEGVESDRAQGQLIRKVILVCCSKRISNVSQAKKERNKGKLWLQTVTNERRYVPCVVGQSLREKERGGKGSRHCHRIPQTCPIAARPARRRGRVWPSWKDEGATIQVHYSVKALNAYLEGLMIFPIGCFCPPALFILMHLSIFKGFLSTANAFRQRVRFSALWISLTSFE